MYNIVQNKEKALIQENAMRQVSFTEFRMNAASFFNSVEQGETIRILRHGKPIAEVVPVQTMPRTLSWKRPGLVLKNEGASLSRELLKEREREAPSVLSTSAGLLAR